MNISAITYTVHINGYNELVSNMKNDTKGVKINLFKIMSKPNILK